jgi:polyisoprenoid-binding protein YceI
MHRLVAFAVFPIAIGTLAQERDVIRLDRSSISFLSEAPLEAISAATDQAKGVIDRGERSFAVQVPVASFAGFNAPLQREHFNENYMASADWPNAQFTGRIIEMVDLRAPGKHAVRAKGTLTIRGVPHERIIPCTVEVDAAGVTVTSRFEVVLEDHGVRIPRVVQQKVAATVAVSVDLHFAP